MKQYKVLRNCWGFQGKYWTEGKVVDLPDDADPPYHFEFIGTVEKTDPPPLESFRVKSPDPKDIMAPRPAEFGKPVRVTGGFASKTDYVAPKEVLTAAQAFKKRGRPKKIETAGV